MVAEIAALMSKWDEIVFLDDNKNLKEVNGYKVLGGLRDYIFYKAEFECAFVAIGNNKFRAELIDDLLKNGLTIPTLIHPFTSISNNTLIDIGTVVMAGVVINSNTIIGRGCIINTSSSIDHDCILKDGVHISPGVHIGGFVTIDNCSWVCIGSSIVNKILIGKNAIVAAGATVTKNVPDNVMIAGVPAIIKSSLE